MIIDSSPNPRRRASAVRYHRGRSALLGFPVGPTYRFPIFQLDEANHALHPVAVEANERLDARNRPWEVGAWWCSANPALRGRTPMEALAARELDFEILDPAIAASTEKLPGMGLTQESESG